MRQVQLTAAEFRARRCGAKPPGGKYHVADKADRTIHGITFDSKREMERYLELRQLQADGTVKLFLRQPRFDLPGKTKYFADFLVIYANGTYRVEDVKGMRTQIYKLKKRQVEELYPNVKIEEV
jgi:hypothetical protein